MASQKSRAADDQARPRLRPATWRLRSRELIALVLAALPAACWFVFLELAEVPRGFIEVNRPMVFALRLALLASAGLSCVAFAMALMGVNRGTMRMPVAFAVLAVAIVFLRWSVPLLIDLPGNWLQKGWS